MPARKEEWACEIERIASRGGADIVGFADLKKLKGVRTHPKDLIDKFPYAVSVVVGLERFGEYRNATEDDLAFPLLDRIANELKKYITSRGYSAKVILADKRVSANSPLYWHGEISHKAVAKTAGIGWIGRSSLLVTPSMGPRVNLATVLTDMPLPTGRPTRNMCGHCRACIAACPLDALRYSAFKDHPKDIENAVDVKRCGAFVNKTWRNLELCYECMLACPRGKTKRKVTS